MGATGIIPACAGSTNVTEIGSIAIGDHPRMRGEHVAVERLPTDRLGSSPHARGAHQHPDSTLADEGIIPACAGSTRFHA